MKPENFHTCTTLLLGMHFLLIRPRLSSSLAKGSRVSNEVGNRLRFSLLLLRHLPFLLLKLIQREVLKPLKKNFLGELQRYLRTSTYIFHAYYSYVALVKANVISTLES